MKYKIMISFIFIGVLGFLVSGSSLAYFTSNVENYDLATFSSGAVKIKVAEGTNLSSSTVDFVENRNLEWNITNKSTEVIRLRVKVLESSSKNKDIILTSSKGWTQGDDGIYYYSELVPVEETVVFPLKVLFDTWDKVEGYKLDIEAEAIQGLNDAVDYEWVNSL